MRTKGQPTIQGYNAQAAVTAEQIIVAAEITTASPDFGHLEPVFEAALRGPRASRRERAPETVVADAGYWHKRQMEKIVMGGTQVLVPPDSDLQEKPAPAGPAGSMTTCDASSGPSSGTRSTSSANRPSSPCSDTPNTTGGSTASNAAAAPQHYRNGD